MTKIKKAQHLRFIKQFSFVMYCSSLFAFCLDLKHTCFFMYGVSITIKWAARLLIRLLLLAKTININGLLIQCYNLS